MTSIYSHPNEMWALETSPNNSDLIITSANGLYNHDNKSKTLLNLFRMPNQTHDIIHNNKEQRDSVYAGNKLELDHITSLDCASNYIVNNIKWNTYNNIITSDSQYLSIFNITNDNVKVIKFYFFSYFLSFLFIFIFHIYNIVFRKSKY